MPLQTVALQPGVNAEITPVQGATNIVSSQLVRWKSAGNNRLPSGIAVPDILIEKLGGWTQFYPTPLGSPIRALHAWEGINADLHLAIGCMSSLVVITSGLAQDVTPRTMLTNPTPNFSTTSGSAAVTLVDAGIAVSVYDVVDLLTPVSVGGLILRGSYQVQTVISSSSYTITAPENATSTVSNGGDVPAFTTTSGDFAVNVLLSDHGLTVGESFQIAVATSVGGIVLAGSYIVQSVTDADNFIINATNAATSTATVSENGGDVRLQYFITVAPSQPAAGYGVGTYGSGSYGEGVAPQPSPGTPITTTNWALDNWGEILLGCPVNGPIYAWSPDSGFTNAAIVNAAPLINGGVFVSNTAQILVAWASSINGVQDPLLVQWSDSGDYTNWTASALTQAGNFRLATGSRIVGALAGPAFNVIWTDLDVWSMDYVEPPIVYGFNNLATNCGLISRHAGGVVNATVMWMGNRQFFLMSGESVEPIPCAVWDFVFQDLDESNVDKITCAPNNGFGEMTWFFPSLSGGTGEVDSYVKVNFNNGFVWDFGRLQRTAWIDQSVLGEPIGGDASGYLYQHETSPDANGQPLISSFQTGFFQISDGDDLMFVDWIIPDFKWTYYGESGSAAVSITLFYCDYPGAPVNVAGPYTFTQATQFVSARLRGRFVSFKIESTDLGSWWRFGGTKFRAAPAGKR